MNLESLSVAQRRTQHVGSWFDAFILTASSLSGFIYLEPKESEKGNGRLTRGVESAGTSSGSSEQRISRPPHATLNKTSRVKPAPSTRDRIPASHMSFANEIENG